VAQLDEVILGGDPPDLLLARGPHLDDDARRLLLHPLAEVLDHLEAHVRLQQRGADVLEGLVDGGLVQLGQSLEPLLGRTKAFGECLEHGRRNLPRVGPDALPDAPQRRRHFRSGTTG
jgi:hypothetical protein